MFGVLPVCRLPPKMGQMPRKACTVNAFVIYLCVCVCVCAAHLIDDKGNKPEAKEN